MNLMYRCRMTAITVALGSVTLAAAELPEPAATRAAFLKVLDRPRVEPALEERVVESAGGLTQLHLSFASEAGQRVPCWLVKKTGVDGKRPAVIVLHCTGGCKEDSLGLARTLAMKGFVGIAMDGRYNGERAGTGGLTYDAAIAQAYRDGKSHPFLYDTVWDVMRLIDVLQSRPDIDAARIGVIGFSKGGMETYLLAAADERVTVAVPCIGVQCWRYAMDHNLWQHRLGSVQGAANEIARELGVPINLEFVQKFYDRLVPGIYSDFDGPVILPLIAPRALMVINGDQDTRNPLPGVMLAADAARAAYMNANAPEHFVLNIQQNTGHSVTSSSMDAAVAWFQRWLLPNGPG
jgi:fermentation-respiration switch protein FrsA (DUF1100 family)